MSTSFLTPILLSFLLLLLYFPSPARPEGGALPEYELAYNLLINRSRAQEVSLHMGVVPLPGMVNINPALSPWPWGGNNGKDIEDKTMVLWCPRKAWKPPCQYSTLPSSSFPSSPSFPTNLQSDLASLTSAFASLPPKKSVMYDAYRYGHMIEDSRTIMLGGKLFIIYNVRMKTYNAMHMAELKYNKSEDVVYIDFPTDRLDISHEMGSISQKNWAPFVYGPSGKETLYFVYSILPHRIVVANETVGAGLLRANTAYLTTLPSSLPTWPCGEPRGGTQPIPISTDDGPRYLAIFHSSGKCLHPAIKTWYIGAYMFRAEPPFDITHFATEALVPEALYDSNGGWAYKAVDYIVFPLSLTLRGDRLYVTVGKNDKVAFVVALSLKALVNSLKKLA